MHGHGKANARARAGGRTGPAEQLETEPAGQLCPTNCVASFCDGYDSLGGLGIQSGGYRWEGGSVSFFQGGSH